MVGKGKEVPDRKQLCMTQQDFKSMIWAQGQGLRFYGLLLLGGFPEGFPGGSESACNAGDGVKSLGQEDSLEKGMAIHSSILAWKIPQTEETVELQPMGSQRVGHN